MGFVTDLREGRIGIDWSIPYGPDLWRAVRDYPGKFYSKINTVIQFLEVDCGSKWFVYVQLALPALGNVVLALIDFDWDDVARGFIRPYGPRTRLGLRRPSKAKIRVPDLPELGEEIGVRIPGAKLIKSRAVSKLERFFWVVDGILQRALFWWMIIDLTVDFFYNWIFGVFKTTKCSGSGYGGIWNKKRGGFAVCHDWSNVALSDVLTPFTVELEKWGNWQEIRDPLRFGHPTKSVNIIYEYGFRPGFANPSVQIGVFDARDGRLLEYQDVFPHVHNVIAYRTQPGQYVYVRNRALCGGSFPFYYEDEHYLVVWIG